MSSQVHGVMQDPQYQHPRLIEFIGDQVARIADHAAFALRPRPAMAKVLGPNPNTRLGTIQAAQSNQFSPQISEGGLDQRLIAATRANAKVRGARIKYFREIVLRRERRLKTTRGSLVGIRRRRSGQGRSSIRQSGL
jgi:hypothetical protein